jgi:AGCS family alanine or glycine:cation symporter
MYYLSKGLAEKGKAGFGKVIAALFAVMCIFGCLGGGNMFQGNQAYQMIANTFGIFTESGWLFGLILAIIVGAVIIGGIKSIARVTEKIVPLMAILYVGTALIILLANIGKIPWAFGLVIKGAFVPTAIGGGIVGVMIQGLKRAAFSNEAGVGSAAIAHSAVKTNEPLTEGYVALLEPFIDTVVICTMTALVIVITGAFGTEGLTGVALTSSAFQSVFPWFGIILAIAVLLFAFSTMISWSYYGLKSWTYLFGEGKNLVGLPVGFPLVRYHSGYCCIVVRLFHNDFLVLLWPEKLDLSVRGGQDLRADLQDHFLRVRHYRMQYEFRAGHRFLGCSHLCHVHLQCNRVIYADGIVKGRSQRL